MQSVAPPLGKRVRARAYLLRRYRSGKDRHMRDVVLKSWERQALPEPIEGFHVGIRIKSNGSVDGDAYDPIAFFEAWLVAYNQHRDHLVCLPQDIEEV